MGNLKQAKLKKTDKTITLTPFQANFLKALVLHRNESYNAYQAAVQLYLSSLGFDYLGIQDSENYEFSADLEKGTVSVSPKDDKIKAN